MTVVLVAADEPDTAAVIGRLLSRAGHEVIPAADGRAALREAYQCRPDLIILDAGLPQLDGHEVLERLRVLTDAPILMLTAAGMLTAGMLTAGDPARTPRPYPGADDYLARPFQAAELATRVAALLRREGTTRTWIVEAYDDGVIHLDPLTHRACVHGAEVNLTAAEFQLLHTLVRHPGATLTPAQLLAPAGGDPDGPAAVRQAVPRLRRKLGWDDPRTSPLQSVPGVGYRYRQPRRD